MTLDAATVSLVARYAQRCPRLISSVPLKSNAELRVLADRTATAADGIRLKAAIVRVVVSARGKK